MLHDEHAERHSNHDGNRHRDQNECDVVKGGAPNFRAVRNKERPGRHAGAPGTACSEAANAFTSG